MLETHNPNHTNLFFLIFKFINFKGMTIKQTTLTQLPFRNHKKKSIICILLELLQSSAKHLCLHFFECFLYLLTPPKRTPWHSLKEKLSSISSFPHNEHREPGKASLGLHEAFQPIDTLTYIQDVMCGRRKHTDHSYTRVGISTAVPATPCRPSFLGSSHYSC